MIDVFLKENERGFLALVNGDGEMVGPQNSVVISQSVDSLTEVTVKLSLLPENQMYKEAK